MIVKILCTIAAVLCAVNGTFFTVCGFIALQQGNMENVAKSVMLVLLMALTEFICIVNLNE